MARGNTNALTRNKSLIGTLYRRSQGCNLQLGSLLEQQYSMHDIAVMVYHHRVVMQIGSDGFYAPSRLLKILDQNFFRVWRWGIELFPAPFYVFSCSFPISAVFLLPTP